MGTVATLIIFSAVGAVICAKTRAAAPALLFGVFAVVLFCTTPLGSGLPDLLGSVVGLVSDLGSGLLNATAAS